MLSLLLAAALAPSASVPSTPVMVPPPAPPVVMVAPPPAPPLPPVDPAKIALARASTNAIFGDGSMGRMFDRLLSPAPNSYASTMLDMTFGELMTMMPQTAKMPDMGPMASMTMRQMMAKDDPYFNQRLASIHDAVVAEAVRLGPKFEPQMREGLAISMARRFSAGQLTDMGRFFSSPSGHAFGDEMYLMWMDPAVIKSMMSAIPALSAELPASMKAVKAAYERYPLPKRTETHAVKLDLPAAPKAATKPAHRRKK